VHPRNGYAGQSAEMNMKREADEPSVRGGREPTVGLWGNDPQTGSRVRYVGDPLSPDERNEALQRNQEELIQRRRNKVLMAILGSLLVGFSAALLALIFRR
jgi:hypothetical protein